MKAFTKLFNEIDQTTKTNAKIAALERFFNEADDKDKIWAIALFTHKRPRRTINTRLIREWAAEAAGLPLWLFEESYHIVGDLAETIALVLPDNQYSSDKSLAVWIESIVDMKNADEEEKKSFVLQAWDHLDTTERFLFNKLITGGFRIGVSQKLITKGLARSLDTEEQTIAHRLMGNWSPLTTTYKDLILSDNKEDNLSRPYPFYLAYALEGNVSSIGFPEDWFAERKWDGIRGQIIKREQNIYVWSRGEELVTDKFPEFNQLLSLEEDNFVLDGEIICSKDGEILPFNILQTRIGRKKVAKKHLTTAPVIMIVYDLLEYNGEDIRKLPMYERRTLLEAIMPELQETGVMTLSPIIKFNSWQDLEQERELSRDYNAEGIMLKMKNSIYKVGRKRGEWWKWKVDPMTVDAVMIYAQRGHGRRANLYTDFTFGVWDEAGKLVPFTKAYSGLTDKEFRQISHWVKRNTVERFGPVCMVNPVHVFEIAFEGIAESKRHKSGVALRFPRMKRWRKDKPPSEADTLVNLKKLLS